MNLNLLIHYLGGNIMTTYSKEQIVQMVEKENVRFIRLQFTDLFGAIKNVEIPVSQLEKALIIK